jgi:hypothetical protein
MPVVREHTPYPHAALADIAEGFTDDTTLLSQPFPLFDPRPNDHVTRPASLRAQHRVAQQIAIAAGAPRIRDGRYQFYSRRPHLKLHLDARSICRHRYGERGNIIYSIKEGKSIQAKGDAEFLAVFYDDVKFALEGYWERHPRTPEWTVRRYFAFYGGTGPYRECFWKFLADEDHRLYEQDLDLAEAVASLLWSEEFA